MAMIRFGEIRPTPSLVIDLLRIKSTACMKDLPGAGANPFDCRRSSRESRLPGAFSDTTSVR
jgi:hypothetical protein